MKCFGLGFLEVNLEFVGKFKLGEINFIEWFNELLWLVYCLIFFMVVEDWNLFYLENVKVEVCKFYVEGYSFVVLWA